MAKFSESDWEVILAATHTEMTTEPFQALVKAVTGNSQGSQVCSSLYRPRLPADA